MLPASNNDGGTENSGQTLLFLQIPEVSVLRTLRKGGKASTSYKNVRLVQERDVEEDCPCRRVARN